MDELLQKLLESQVLSAETKAELETAFKAKIEDAVKDARDSTTADVRAELTEQYITERDQLIEAIDTKVGEMLASEIVELKEDIERFRDLEAEFAEKLVEAKSAMSDELKSDLSSLVEKIDAFLEIRLSSELEELREDFAEVRKNEFGRKIFEAFAQEFVSNYADEDSAEASLRDQTAKVEELEAKLEEAEKARALLDRKIKLENVLAPLSGTQREIMETILKNVETSLLESAYKTFIGRVLKEGSNSEKETPVLAEGASEKKVAPAAEKAALREKLKEAVVATGDNDEDVIKENELSPEKKAHLAHIRRLAGV